jgi:hypothetical protein
MLDMVIQELALAHEVIDRCFDPESREGRGGESGHQRVRGYFVKRTSTGSLSPLEKAFSFFFASS